LPSAGDWVRAMVGNSRAVDVTVKADKSVITHLL